ncbi:MAG: Gfo/Idh/MocA family oxidoreductase [Oscillospiraceae bacterium]|nr:Gfo/Idh/MocA family oxidoreductase [Oscillospiraceae bacterium]
MGRLKFIHVGTGNFGMYWGKTVIPLISSFAECVAAVDIDPEALDNFKALKRLPENKHYADLRVALTENKCDFISVVVMPGARLPIIDLAIEFGVDVLCEKPAAGTMDDYVTIYKKMKAAGRKIAVTMSHRYEREKQTVEQMIKSGAYGKLNYIYGRFASQRPKARNKRYEGADPAMLTPYNLARRGLSEGVIHEFDTFRGMTGQNAAKVYCQYWQFDPEDGSDTQPAASLTSITMENGVRCLIEHSGANAVTINGWSNEHFRAECANATIIADNKKVTIMSGMGQPYPETAEMPLQNGEYFDHGQLARDFCDWLNGGPEPQTSLEDNMQCAALTFAALESAFTGKEIDVQAFLKEHMEK